MQNFFKLKPIVRSATKKIFMILKVLYLIAFMVEVTEQSECGTYRAENGKICHMCNPGNYKTGDCMKNGMPARCLQCPDGTYQTTCNQALSCAPCSPYCPYYNSSKVSECNKTSDIRCQCNTGFHFEGDVDGTCNKHKSCPPSQGVKMQGTPFNDTVCEPCIPGKTFSNVSSSMQQCRNCTTCPTISECTPVNDTVCAIVAVKPDKVMDQHGLSIEHIVGTVGACIIGIIAIICVAIAVGYYRLHRNHPGKPRNPDGECPQEVVELAHVAPSVTGQVASPVAGQVVPPEANYITYRTTNEMNGYNNDVEEDGIPINQNDRDLHEQHMHAAAKYLGPDNARFSDEDSREQTHPKENISGAQQTEIIAQDAPTPSKCRIPTASEVTLILNLLTSEIVKNFPTFFRFLVPLSVKHDQEMPNIDAWIQQEYGDWSSNTKEARYQLLYRWKCQHGGVDEKFCTNINEALRHSGENEVLAKLKQKFSGCFAHNC